MLITCFFFGLAIEGAAQISLTQASYPASVTGTDSLKVSVYNAVFPVIAIGSGNLWDLSNITDSTPVFFDYRVPATTYQYADSNYSVLIAYPYQANVQSSILATGMVDHGIKIEDTAYSISPLTLGSQDSFFIPAQNILYSSLHDRVAFPATYNSSWSSNYRYDLGFELSIAISSYSHAPGFRRTYLNETDTVTGWGLMRVKDISGNPSAYQAVLQVCSRIIRTDSFFLNGAPMAGTTTGLFGIVQGKTDTSYVQNYYRSGEVTPLASVQFRDAAYTQPFKATTHVQRLYPSAITDIADKKIITAYPNPLNKEGVHVVLPGDGVWHYILTDIRGRICAEGSLIIDDHEGELILPQTIMGGRYALTLCNNAERRTIQLDIIR